MDKISQNQLAKAFPILYQDINGSIQESCMPWGFDVEQGWASILWNLSLAIDKELNYSWFQKISFITKKKLSIKWNKFIYSLSPVHYPKYKSTGKGTKEPYSRILIEAAKQDIIGRFFQKFFPKSKSLRIGLKNLAWFPYTGFKVTQVKEKYGTLRYYTSESTKNIDKLIDKAEELSATTCEKCGKIGKIRSGGWIVVRCDTCYDN